MANQLSKTGIQNSQTIQAWHVTQSIDALTAAEAYDITISGSLTLTGSVSSLNGFTGDLVGTASWASNATSATNASSASIANSATTALLATTASYAVSARSASYAATASSADTLTVRTALTANGLNYPTADGAADEFLTTDGSGNLAFDWVKTLHQNIHNATTSTIVRGTPLYISGSTGDNANVYLADSSITNRRPATLIAYDNTLAPGATGTGIISGEVQGVNTNAYPEGTIVYLAAGGGWTATRPTGSDTLVQALGVITRQANNGRGIVFNQIGNSLPNITSGYTWVGDSDAIPTPTTTASILGAGSYGGVYQSGSVAGISGPLKFIAGASETDGSGAATVTVNELTAGGIRVLNQTFFVTLGVEDVDPTKTVSIRPGSFAPTLQFTSSVANTRFHFQIMYI